MFSFAKNFMKRDPLKTFLNKPHYMNPPTLNVPALDVLFRTLGQNLPKDWDNASFINDVARGPLAGLLNLSDAEAALGHAALLLMRPQGGSLNRHICFLQHVHRRPILWSDDITITLLQKPDIFKYLNDVNVLPSIIEASFPQGIPSKVNNAIANFLDGDCFDPTTIDSFNEQTLLKLEDLIGRDREKNPIRLQKKRFAQEYFALKKEVMDKIGPHMRVIINTIEREGISTEELDKLDSEFSKDLGSEDRAVLFRDIICVRQLLRHNGRIEARINFDEDLKLIRSGFFQQMRKSLSIGKKLAFTDALAKDTIRAAFVWERGREVFGLKTEKAPVIMALAKAITQPDAELAARIRNRCRFSENLGPITDALSATPTDELDFSYLPVGSAKPQQNMNKAHRDLRLTMQRLPGRWVQVKTNKDGIWKDFDHQTYPYFSEIRNYAKCIGLASGRGYDISFHLDALRELYNRAEHHLELLRQGNFITRSLDEIIQDFPKHEDVSIKNTYWTLTDPKDKKDVFDNKGRAKIQLISEIETRHIGGLASSIESIENVRPRPGLGQRLAVLARESKQPRPTKKWLTEATKSLSTDDLNNILARLMYLATSYDMRNVVVGLNITETISAFIYNNVPKTMVWGAHLAGEQSAEILYNIARNSFKRVPSQGMKNKTMGNAALFSLTLLENNLGVPYLMKLEREVKYASVKKTIALRLDEASAAAGLTKDDLEETLVTDHGFVNGEHRIELAGGAALLSTTGCKVELTWEDDVGKQRKTLPESIKVNDPNALKTVRSKIKEIEADLVTWRGRLEGSYLRDRSWSYNVWRERYANHGTLSILAKALLWTITTPSGTYVIRPFGNECVDVSGVPIDCQGGIIQLWHPLDSLPSESTDWRRALEKQSIRQPFRQAWRETYVLTGAEKETAIYSNRFAGHVVRQHQVMALGTANGWQSTHRTVFDTPDDQPTHIRIPEFELQAEFWTNSLSHDAPSTPEGSHLYLSTDRLKFHQLDPKVRFGKGNEKKLQDVPQRIFSEIMRHCDLFTSVASISLDPAWEDRGHEAEHPNQWRDHADAYWTRSHSAPLNVTAETRREMLSIIVPRMANASSLEVLERHLRVTGKRHVYLIHLGSGAVLIEKTRKHVCIVPAGSEKSILLPYEGDRTLSTIVSKALLLIEDDKIEDSVILAQI